MNKEHLIETIVNQCNAQKSKIVGAYFEKEKEEILIVNPYKDSYYNQKDFPVAKLNGNNRKKKKRKKKGKRTHK